MPSQLFHLTHRHTPREPRKNPRARSHRPLVPTAYLSHLRQEKKNDRRRCSLIHTLPVCAVSRLQLHIWLKKRRLGASALYAWHTAAGVSRCTESFSAAGRAMRKWPRPHRRGFPGGLPICTGAAHGAKARRATGLFALAGFHISRRRTADGSFLDDGRWLGMVAFLFSSFGDSLERGCSYFYLSG